MDWFTLRVISGKEKKIKEAILYDISLSDMGDQIKDVLVLVDILLLVLFLFSSTVKRARETIDSMHYYNIVSQR